MAGALYLDTSAVLRAAIESGTTPDVEERIREARLLITSRLAQVEAARAFLRLRQRGEVAEARLADAERAVQGLWARCEIWELTRSVCELAQRVAPAKPLRALDALHLATFVLARQRIEALEMLTVDDRMHDAAGIA